MFKEILSEFDDNINGIRFFVSELEPFIKLQKQKYQANFTPLVLQGLLNEVDTSDKSKEEVDKILESKNKIEEIILKEYGRKLDIKVNDFKIDDDDKMISISGINIGNMNRDVKNNIKKYNRTQNQLELLYKNNFLSLLSSIEWFFSQIIHTYYTSFPKSAGINKKSLTFEELKTFETITDAENFLIESKIEGLLRGSFEDWFIFLKTDLKLKIPHIDNVKNILIEIYQRRNLIIHNGGKVNSIYLSKVDKSLLIDINKDDFLNIEKEYLEKAICRLHSTFLIVCAELWKQVEPNNQHRSDILLDIIYENLLTENWDVASQLSLFCMNDKKSTPVNKAISRLNYWLCKKRLFQWDSIKKEIENTDFSDKTELIQIGLAAIKEDSDSFFELINKILKNEILTCENILEYPIFHEMRETDLFLNFVEESGYFSDYEIQKFKKRRTSIEEDTIEEDTIEEDTIEEDTIEDAVLSTIQ